MRVGYFLILLLLFGWGCKHKSEAGLEDLQKFDKEKWATREGRHYPYRNAMLNDLIANVKLHGLKKDSLIELLGEPDRCNEGHLYYTIRQPYLGNLVPLYTKSLVIKLTKDSTVEWRKIHE